jgi:hypothetical protein
MLEVTFPRHPPPGTKAPGVYRSAAIVQRIVWTKILLANCVADRRVAICFPAPLTTASHGTILILIDDNRRRKSLLASGNGIISELKGDFDDRKEAPLESPPYFRSRASLEGDAESTPCASEIGAYSS